ncbi:MAG: T9SS type A sorting domain-containing protein [Bacteroidota bacterium]
MWKNFFFRFRTLTSFFLIITSFTYLTKAQPASKVYSKFNINRISTYIYNDGIADIQLNSNSGFEFPKGSKLYTNYCGGFIWGGKVNGKIISGGSSYRSGLRPGKILSNGKAEDPNSDNVRVFRVRRDYKTADLRMEAKDEKKNVNEIYKQYEKDWEQWPASDGAPFEDINKDGVYQPGIDIPGVIGANQTLWFAANDLDSAQTKYFTGSLPIGIEMQVTVWGYKYDGTYRGDALFKKYVLINKSKNEIKEMRLGIWADPDVGEAGNDLVGCDTTLNMVYMFSSNNNDAMYGAFSPAFGYSLLQGPVINGLPSDKAIFKNRIIAGKKNLPMSAMGWVFKNVIEWADPQFGTDKTAEQLYHFLMGKSISGLDWQIPQRLGGGITRFPFSGDYVNKTGYYDGVEYSPMDRRMMLCMGPFNFAAGDTQEVVFMESAAGADRSANNLEAITLLKKNMGFAKKYYSNEYKYYINPNELSVNVLNGDKRIMLYWNESKEKIYKIEKEEYEIKFQGYVVYQFPDSSYNKTEAKIIAIFDKHDGLLKFQSLDFDNLSSDTPSIGFLVGSDSGIMRNILIGYDKLNNTNLVNWRDYYFGVSTISTTTNNNINYYYETDFIKCKARPAQNADGIQYSLIPGYLLDLRHTAGNNSDYIFYLYGINPGKFGNYEYEITFKKVNSELKLNLKNLTTGKEIFINEPITFYDQYPMFDGIVLKIDRQNQIHRPLTEADVYRFSTKESIRIASLHEEDLTAINVFPNPFYGLNRMDTQSSDKFVTFTHLPHKALIRIFNLSGQLVRILEKNSTAKTITWNLSNNDGWQIPGGFYIARIELPDYGKIKTLKMIIIQSSSIKP